MDTTDVLLAGAVSSREQTTGTCGYALNITGTLANEPRDIAVQRSTGTAVVVGYFSSSSVWVGPSTTLTKIPVRWCLVSCSAIRKMSWGFATGSSLSKIQSLYRC